MMLAVCTVGAKVPLDTIEAMYIKRPAESPCMDIMDSSVPQNRECPLNMLDDGVLLAVMSHLNPMPDHFVLARTCLRLKRLAHDRTNNLVVCNQGPITGANHYRTLTAAVSASRPGDTIFLTPGIHAVQATITTQHVLHIRGGGDGPESTFICGPGHADATLDVRHTCKLTNVTISSNGLGPGVMHQSGMLSLERCHVRCMVPPGLAHLPGCAPLVTTAGGSRGQGPGKLSVAECTVEGGSKAVHCLGGGAVQAVRAVYQARKTWLYFDIDCRGGFPPATQAPPVGAAAITRAAKAAHTTSTAGAAATLSAPLPKQAHGVLPMGVEALHECAPTQGSGDGDKHGSATTVPAVGTGEAVVAGCQPAPRVGSQEEAGAAGVPGASNTKVDEAGRKRAHGEAAVALQGVGIAGIAKLARLLHCDAVPVAVFGARLQARQGDGIKPAAGGVFTTTECSGDAMQWQPSVVQGVMNGGGIDERALLALELEELPH